MFDTKTTDYRVTHESCPFHENPAANIALEVFNSFRARKFAVSCYFSKSDWHCPWYWVPERPAPDRNPNYDTHAEPEIWERFVKFAHDQVRELMTGYGPIDVLWLDGGQVRPPLQDIRMDDMAAMARSLQPGLIVADRTVGGAHENIVTPEQEIPDTPSGRPWETCLTIGKSWSYRPDEKYKQAGVIIELLVDIVSKGGNLLLNVGPSPDGVIDENAVRQLEEVGKWLNVNGEAVYGSRPAAPYREGNIRFTGKDGFVYAFIFPQDGNVLPENPVILKNMRIAPGTAPRLLGSDQPVDYKLRDCGTELILPAVPPPGGYAWVVKQRIV